MPVNCCWYRQVVKTKRCKSGSLYPVEMASTCVWYLLSSTTPRLNTARLRAQAGTPEGLVGVSGRILKCKLVHMKAGSILLNPSNRKTRIHIVRYVLSYLNGYKDTYPKIRKDMIHIQKFSHARRILPAFICTNPHLHILPETRASFPGVPVGARTIRLS